MRHVVVAYLDRHWMVKRGRDKENGLADGEKQRVRPADDVDRRDVAIHPGADPSDLVNVPAEDFETTWQAIRSAV